LIAIALVFMLWTGIPAGPAYPGPAESGRASSVPGAGEFAPHGQAAAGAATGNAQAEGVRTPGRASDGAPPFRWGIYQIYWGPEHFRTMLQRSIAPLASRPQLVLFYRDLGRPFPAKGCRIVGEIGAAPVIALELWRWGRHPSNQLPDIRDGDYDDFFRKWAEGARDFGKQVFLRFGFEMNGDWFTWGDQPDVFVAAWRRIHAIFREVGADNVLWVWTPNCVSIPRGKGNAIPLYYPGDEFVDWVGLDGYNFGDHHDRWHAWEGFDAIFGDGLALLEERYPGKPIMIGEFACAPGPPGRKAAWIQDAYRCLRADPRIRAAVWFNLDKRDESEPNWLIRSDPGALDAFNQTFARSPDAAAR
jgi:hypothetical protein